MDDIVVTNVFINEDKDEFIKAFNDKISKIIDINEKNIEHSSDEYDP